MSKPPTVSSRLRKLEVGDFIIITDKSLQQVTSSAWLLSRRESLRFNITQTEDGLRVERLP